METIKLHQNEIEYLINSVEVSKYLGNDRLLAERIINKLQKVKKFNTPRVSVAKRKVCPECKGTKRVQNEWDELETCSTCKGKGQT